MIRCFHKSKSPRVIGVVYGGHLADLFGCRAYPGARHEEVTLICDKCGREWVVRMAELREVVEQKKLRNVDVSPISRRWRFTGA